MMRLISWLADFGRFWYRFIIGDDWTVAASLAVGLAVTPLLNASHFPAWVVIPLIVIVMLRVSISDPGARPARSGRNKRLGAELVASPIPHDSTE